MAKGKYGYRIQQDDESWMAEITRKVTSRKIKVSKREGGFPTEADAEEWAKKELAIFLANLEQRNKRRSIERERTAERLKEKQASTVTDQTGTSCDQ